MVVVVVSVWLPLNVSWSASTSVVVTSTELVTSVVSETTLDIVFQVLPVDSVLWLSTYIVLVQLSEGGSNWIPPT